MNCNAGGSCQGGNADQVYEFAQTHGIPHDSCQTYLAANPEDATCTGTWVCEDCSPPVGSKENCVSRKPQYVFASDYGDVSGADDIKQEIFQRGPIACGIAANDALVAQTGGIFSFPDAQAPGIDHIISLVGFGKDTTGQEYWIGRNSWGSHWGENGQFRIMMHKNNLHVEDECVWATPSLTQSTPLVELIQE